MKKGSKNPRLDAQMLFCSSLNMDRVSLYANYNKILDEEEKQK